MKVKFSTVLGHERLTVLVPVFSFMKVVAWVDTKKAWGQVKKKIIIILILKLDLSLYVISLCSKTQSETIWILLTYHHNKLKKCKSQ